MVRTRDITGTAAVEVVYTPEVRPDAGTLWIERGGVYVVGIFVAARESVRRGMKRDSNKTKVIYDDFAAVDSGFIARKLTSPRRLGIEAGSNWGWRFCSWA